MFERNRFYLRWFEEYLMSQYDRLVFVADMSGKVIEVINRVADVSKIRIEKCSNNFE